MDKEWDEMLAKYIERVPVPVFRTDPPIKSRLEDQFKQEEQEPNNDDSTEVSDLNGLPDEG